MKVNIFVQSWCDDDYNRIDEDFYTMNARWIIDRQWSRGSIAHGIFAGILAVFVLILGLNQFGVAIFAASLILAVLSTCFFFYGIRKYDGNSSFSALLVYIIVLVFLVLTLIKIGIVISCIYAVAGTVLYVYLTFVRPSKFNAFRKAIALMTNEMKKEIDKANEQADLKNYAQWAEKHTPIANATENQPAEIPSSEETLSEADDKAESYRLLDLDSLTDISDEEALRVKVLDLFAGYSDSKKMLHDRYLSLAKDAHPDNGGDERIFSCIKEIYETINESL